MIWTLEMGNTILDVSVGIYMSRKCTKSNKQLLGASNRKNTETHPIFLMFKKNCTFHVIAEKCLAIQNSLFYFKMPSYKFFEKIG